MIHYTLVKRHRLAKHGCSFAGGAMLVIKKTFYSNDRRGHNPGRLIGWLRRC
jgi:hypothetical protein